MVNSGEFMSKGKELEIIKEKAERAISEAVILTSQTDSLNELYFVMGGLDAINVITTNLNSALILKLQNIRDTHGYRAAGFARFDIFMDEFPKSPMSYKRFNYIENIFKNLGSDVFDLTSSSGLSMRQMKMIGKGNVEINGDRVIVQSDDGPIEIEIANRRQWMESLKVLADGNAEKNIKIERLKDKEARHDDKVREIYVELDTVKASKIAATASNPHMIARVELGIAFRKLAEAAEQISGIEKEQFRDAVLEDVAAWRHDLATAYATATPTKKGPVELKGDDFGSALDNFLGGVDLDDVGNNDGELADQL